MSPPRAQPPLRGDEAHLYDRYHHQLYRLVLASSGQDPAIAEDACSFAWMQLLRHQPDRPTVLGWLRQVAVREAWLLAKQARRKTPLADSELACEQLADAPNPGHAAVDPAEIVAGRHQARQAAQVLDDLHPRGARYLALHAAGYSYREIAALENITYTAVNRYITEARARIRTRRAQGDETPAHGA